jgi:hypothetical protein
MGCCTLTGVPNNSEQPKRGGQIPRGSDDYVHVLDDLDMQMPRVLCRILSFTIYPARIGKGPAACTKRVEHVGMRDERVLPRKWSGIQP